MMFINTVLCLTLQILASITRSQTQHHHRNYANFEQIPRREVASKNPVFLQPSPVQVPVQTIVPLNPKYPTNLIDNQQTIWDKLVKNPDTYTNFDNLNNYEDIIRKYDSMVNPDLVNGYYVAQPEQLKQIDYNNNFSNNKQKKANIRSYKTEKPGRSKEYAIRNKKDKGRKHRKYRHSEEHNRKKKDNKPLGDYYINDTDKKSKNENNDTLTIQDNKENEKNILNMNNARKSEPLQIRKSNQRQNNINKKDNLQLGNDNRRSTKDNNKKRSTENQNIQNSKTSPTIEYQTNYFNQEEFNKYWQNLMAGNISNPYYFPNDMYPYMFDSFYKSFQDSTKPKNKNSNKKNAKNPKKSNKKQNTEDNRDTIIELSPTLHEATPVTITTGPGPKKDIYLNLKIKNKDLPQKSDITSNAPETTNEAHIQADDDENGKHLIINFFNPQEDDVEYYPDFTLLNHAYLTSSEEEELNQIHRDYFQSDWDFYADKVKSYVEQSNKKSYMKPDFGTLSRKNYDVNLNVETIYAPSKVVNYSQTQKEIQNDEGKEENFWFKEGDTTIVLSRSIN